MSQGGNSSSATASVADNTKKVVKHEVDHGNKEDEKVSKEEQSSGNKEVDLIGNDEAVSSSLPWWTIIIKVLIHGMCIGIYMIPLFGSYEKHSDGQAVLDELHLINNHNDDANNNNSWKDVWNNDYWGRSMNAESSHKSWRPLTIATFRLFHNVSDDISFRVVFHRFINIIIHAAVAELIGQATLLFFPNNCNNWHKNNKRVVAVTIVRSLLSKLLFAFHPSHVECVMNSANRPHILALLFSLLCIDPKLPFLLMALFWSCGLLTSETFIFQLPAVILSITFVRYNFNNDENGNNGRWKQVIYSLVPRYMVLALLSFTYLIYRHINDWISIPDELIRPAENPFFTMTGQRRFFNYAYILTIHILKSWGLDIIGYSHEYGYDCIGELGATPINPTNVAKQDMYKDSRLLFPFAILVLIPCLVIILYYQKYYLSNNNNSRFQALLTVLVAASWYATLFPVSGFLKVGTFVSDRIVVASTVSSCIFGSHFLTNWIFQNENKHSSSRKINTNVIKKLLMTSVVLSFFGCKVHYRSLEWMSNLSLIQSSLVTCPRSIKSHLEMSKIYQGLYPELLDLDKALYHLETAEQIDPSFCDLHQQYTLIYIQQNKLENFEERLTKCMMCPFTMGGCMNIWNQYWPTVMQDPAADKKQIQQRYNKYVAMVNEAAKRQEDERRRKEQKYNVLEESFSDEF